MWQEFWQFYRSLHERDESAQVRYAQQPALQQQRAMSYRRTEYNCARPLYARAVRDPSLHCIFLSHPTIYSLFVTYIASIETTDDPVSILLAENS
jgi:hypothetical protein